MRKEHILFADNTKDAREGFKASMETFGTEGGHTTAGIAGSVEEVRVLVEEKDVSPTVAIIDSKMPDEGDGKKAADIIRKKYPKVVIIALSSGEANWADHNLQKRGSIQGLFEFITNLIH